MYSGGISMRVVGYFSENRYQGTAIWIECLPAPDTVLPCEATTKPIEYKIMKISMN